MTAHTDDRRRETREATRSHARWAAVLYVAVALAAPLLVYSGPDVMSPTVTAFANAAIDGRLSMRSYREDATAARASTAAAAQPRHAMFF